MLFRVTGRRRRPSLGVRRRRIPADDLGSATGSRVERARLAALAALVAVALHLARELVGAEVERMAHVPRRVRARASVTPLR